MASKNHYVVKSKNSKIMPSPFPELLAPAGNLEKLRTALLYGANAAYLGGQAFNLRAGCDGFTPKDLVTAVREAELAKARIYYCLNSLPQERHLADIPGDIEAAAAAGVHAFIVADPGVLRLVRRHAPGFEIHLSTQANTANSEAVAFWADYGVTRINAARELSCRDLYALRKNCPQMELEVFVHGAMCLAISGQCLLSAWLNERPANMGRCTQPCRFAYRTLDTHKENTTESCCATHGGERVVEELTRQGQPVWRVRTDEDYSSFWAPDDLCLLPYLGWFVTTGIHALKIEGRMRSAAYVAHVVDVYATALQSFTRQRFLPKQHETELMAELFQTAVRPMCSGFFLPKRRHCFSPPEGSTESHKVAALATAKPVLARVVEPAAEGTWVIDVRANWKQEWQVELMLPGLRRPTLSTGSYCFENHRGEKAEQVNCGTRALLRTDNPAVIPGIFIRKAGE